MNNNEISKILRFFFVEQGYGIKEFTNDAIWLLKIDEKYPIVCIALNSKKHSNYFYEEWIKYKTLMDCDALLLLINYDVTDLKFAYQNIFETTVLKDVVSKEEFKNNYPDNMFQMLKAKIKYKNGIIPFFTLSIAVVSILAMFVSKILYTSETAFILNGYFRYGILNHFEFYRLFTGLFYSKSIFILLAYLLALYQFEKLYSIQYGRKKLLLLLLSCLFYSNIVMLLVKQDVVISGVTPLITMMITIPLIKFLLLFKKHPQPVKQLLIRHYLIQLMILFFILMNDFYPTLIGISFSLLFVYFQKIKDEKFLKVNFFIAISLLLVAVGYYSYWSKDYISEDMKNQLQNISYYMENENEK